MSTQVHATIDESTVREVSDRLDEPDWLLEERLAALEALDDLEMPDVIRTPGRDWTNLYALDFESLVDPLTAAESKDQVGPDGVAVLPFAEALEERPDLVEEHFGSAVDAQRDYLTALSTALFSTGTVVHVPERVDAEDITVRTEMNSRSLFNYTLVVTEQSSSVTVLERQSTGSEASGASGEPADADEGRYYSGVVEVVAGENSTVQYGSLQDLSEETYNYQLKRGHVPQNATLSFVDGNLGSRLTKASVEAELDGEGAEGRIVGAFFGQDDQHFDIASRVWHNTEHTTADLVTRGVLDDEARSVYEGVQNVGTDAWDTSSYQRENTLMLSEESEADASPKLIINNHDTEASHSATVGQIDQEQLFYMLARGVERRQARNMLVEGFFVPVLDEIELEELREDLQDGVATRLRRDTAEAKAVGTAD